MCAASAGTAAHAQSTPLVFLYGSAAYDHETSVVHDNAAYDSGSPTDAWTFNLGAGCHISKSFVLGVQGGYTRITNVVTDPDALINNNYGQGFPIPMFTMVNWRLGIFGRYTKHLSNRIFFFAQADVTHAQSDYTQDGELTYGGTYNSTAAQQFPTGNSVNATIYPGVGIHIFKGWAIQASIGGLTYNVFNYPDGLSLHHTSFTLGQQFNFGICKTFSNAHKATNSKKTATGK